MGPLHSLKCPQEVLQTPQHRSHNISGTHQGASASESLTGPCPKLLLAVFQLSAFIVVCLAALRATACHSPGVMCAPAACPDLSHFVGFFFGLQLFLCCCRVEGVAPWAKASRDLCVQVDVVCFWGKLPGHQYFCRGTRRKEATVCPKLLKRVFL